MAIDRLYEEISWWISWSISSTSGIIVDITDVVRHRITTHDDIPFRPTSMKSTIDVGGG